MFAQTPPVARPNFVRFALLLACAVIFPTVGEAQTLSSVAGRGACSTAGAEGISRQLAEAQMCIRPGAFVRFAPHPGISLSSSRVHPFAQASARDALHRAAARGTITVNSAFRPISDQYVLYHSGGCGLAARPGRSNHQSGRAVDVGNYSSVRSALEAQGCRWFGSSDRVHFDCPGSDQRADSIRAFQRLWNVNNPGDRISEDGAYGPQTESRLGRAPAGGFARGACDSMPEPEPEPEPEPMPTPSAARLLGVVYEAGDLDARIVGATVRVRETGATATSTATGGWAFDVPAGDYTVEASASGYVTGTHRCTVTAGDTWCSVGLAPGSREGVARGVVFADHGEGFGDTSDRLAGAAVLVTETGARATTDASGAFAHTLAPGSYTFVVSKDGFATASRSCTVTADAEAWCSIGLATTADAGSLQGVVFEGAVSRRVVGARVRVLETGASTTSREGDAFWRFELPPGTYTVEVSGSTIAASSRRCTVASGVETWCSVSTTLTGAGGGTDAPYVEESIVGESDHEGGLDDDPGAAMTESEPSPGYDEPEFRGGLSSGCAAGGQSGAGALLWLVALGICVRRRRA